jgi:recombination protein RecT
MSQSLTKQSALAAPLPTRAANKSLAKCATLQEAFESQELLLRIQQSLPEHMNPQRMLRVFVQAVSRSPNILKVDMRQAIGAFLTCSQLGLEPNTPLQHAHLIPFERTRWDSQRRERVSEGYELNLVIGYKGLIALAWRAPQLRSLDAQLVYPDDDFSFEYGTNRHLRHKPSLHRRSDNVEPIGVYMHATLQGGGDAMEVLSWDDVLHIRNNTQSFKAALAARQKAEQKGWSVPASYSEAPWVKWAGAMGRKTAIRAGVKWLPQSIELAAAAAVDEAGERKRVDFSRVIDESGSILDGGLVPGDDDPGYDDAPEPVQPDATAAFGMRAPAEVPPPVPPPVMHEVTQPKQAAPAAAIPVAAAPAQSNAPPGFEAYLVDAQGDMVKTDGRPAFYRDPIAFSKALVELLNKASPDQRLALMEHNEPGIVDARAASSDARSILDVLGAISEASPPIAQPVAQQSPAVQVPIVRGNPDYTAYLRDLKAALGGLTAETFEAWQAANSTVVGGLPRAVNLQAYQAVEQRRKELFAEGPRVQEQPPAQEEPPLPEPPPAEDSGEPQFSKADLEICDSVLGYINNCKTKHDVTALTQQAAVRAQVNRLPPELKAKVQDRATARFNELSIEGK